MLVLKHLEMLLFSPRKKNLKQANENNQINALTNVTCLLAIDQLALEIFKSNLEILGQCVWKKIGQCIWQDL